MAFGIKSVRSTAADWFKDDFTFRQLCGDARVQAMSERGQEFAAEMVARAKNTGLSTELTVSQLEWLCVLAGWNVPARLAPTAGSRPDDTA